MMLAEEVILVDEQDLEIGRMEKMEAHEKGLLHRAFSIFIFNPDNQLLLQKRSEGKYHSGGLWTNTCCGHPRPGESTINAAKRRLYEEMGFSCNLEKKFDFTYEAAFGNGLKEHEFDHVFFGFYDESPEINTSEASDWKYMDMKKLRKDVSLHSEKYTFWFKICLNKLSDLKL